jgi:fumarate reductase flavoprotein subunit
MKAAFILATAFLILGGCSGGNGKSGSSSSGGMYVPGTYEGSGEGYEGPITVSVTVSENKIIRIEVLEHAETPGYSTAAFKEIIDEVIDFNSTEVDALSGASETSGGLLEAVNEALGKARP